MKTPADPRAIVAVDLGAQSCRVSLLRWLPEGARIQLVHRIANGPISRDGNLHWDLSALCAAADEGLRKCAAVAEEGIAAIGVTGWAVDYVRLDAAGNPIGDPYCYRDPRNAAAMELLHRRISPRRLYELTGIQVLAINTLYQLYADSVAGIPKHLRWLNLPEYMLYRWGARPAAEYTNATHTALLELGKPQWSREVFSVAELDPAAAPELVAPGTFVGRLQGPLAQLTALQDTQLIAPACHDTASAVAGIPAEGDEWAFLSSGTWSLVGTLLKVPCAGRDAAEFNFTNEGAADGNICFLRNINGLWLLQCCMDTWKAVGKPLTLESLLEAAGKLPPPPRLLDVDDPELLSPRDMPQRISNCLYSQHPEASPTDPSTPAAIVNLIMHSLAARYAAVLKQAEQLTGKRFQHLYVVGGGSRNNLLNQLTQQATGLDVICGAVESSTIGNFAVQLSALESGSRTTASQEDISKWARVLNQACADAEMVSDSYAPGSPVRSTSVPQAATKIFEERHA
ncbi:MAG TPA: rhamnulokinase family protein [Acidobacteriaceae bacterium]|nr:rhamnulokinase family protein [Acidobacteriaceae bacterium]